MLRAYVLKRPNGYDDYSDSFEALLVDPDIKDGLKIYFCAGSVKGKVYTAKKTQRLECRHPDPSTTSGTNVKYQSANKHGHNGSGYYETVVSSAPSFGSGIVEANTKLRAANDLSVINVSTYVDTGDLNSYTKDTIGTYAFNISLFDVNSVLVQPSSTPKTSVNNRKQAQKSGDDKSSETSPLLKQDNNKNELDVNTTANIIVAVRNMASKFEKGIFWNGSKKAKMLRDAAKLIQPTDSPVEAYNKVSTALSWQRWFTWFQGPNRKAPKNTLQKFLEYNEVFKDPRKKL